MLTKTEGWGARSCMRVIVFWTHTRACCIMLAEREIAIIFEDQDFLQPLLLLSPSVLLQNLRHT